MATLGVAVVAALAAGCGDRGTHGGRTPARAPATARATIHWTSRGVPHIVADDLESLGFGQGYAFARLHACVFAEQIVRIRGERARFFGAGPGDAHVASDFGMLALDYVGLARERWTAVSAETRQVLTGFAAGFNHYVDKTGRDHLPADCAGAAWVRTLEPVDVAAWGLYLGSLGASGLFVEAMAAAAPPGVDTGAVLPELAIPSAAPASNGWAIGGERTRSGGGMLVANPHFPWEGAHRFWELHLIIPGKLDGYGAALLGSPLINIGLTQQVAWTHTFSASRRFAIYRLTLVDGQPTRYRYGTEIRDMTSRDLSIQVKRADGTLETRTRRVWRSHYGPIVGSSFTPWTATNAFAMRDVTMGLGSGVDQYLGILRATDLASLEAALAKHHFTPFVNTLAVDRSGNVLYVDSSRVPNLSPQALAAWRLARRAVPLVETAWQNGVLALDGSMPVFDWSTDDPVVPLSKAPRLLRRDFVANANQSYWATNPAALLTGYSPLFGDVEQALSARTRMNLTLLTESTARLTAADAERAITSNRSFTGELLRDQVVARCRKARELAAACDVLAAWNGKLDLDSRGAVLWREIAGGLSESQGFAGETGFSHYAESFDPARPLDTPRGLAAAPARGRDPVIEAITRALRRLDSAGVAPDAALGDVQFFEKGDRRFAVHGGGSVEGTTNIVTFARGLGGSVLGEMEPGQVVNPTTGLTTRGYPINYGSSFVLIAELAASGASARALMTYANSSDPRSPHYADQPVLWQDKRLAPVRLSLEEILGDPELSTETVGTPR